MRNLKSLDIKWDIVENPFFRGVESFLRKVFMSFFEDLDNS